MRKVFFTLSTIAIVVSSLLLLKTTPAEQHHPFKTRNKLSKQDRIDLAIAHEVSITKDPKLNVVPRERLIPAAAARNQKFTQRTLSAVPGLSWQERGPSNVAGRTRALIFDLGDGANGYKKVWAGGVGGGIWYTNDITVTSPTWVKVNDLMDNLAITTIAQNPANTQEIYAGTGEGWYNADAIRGLGVWKSSDGGSSWSQLSSTNNSNFYYVQKISISSSGVVYACTQNGLQKSTNGGVSWTKILGTGVGGGLSGNTAISNNAGDIEIAANGDLYCSFGNFFSPGKIYRSVDAGVNWTDISPTTARRIELACAPSDANTVYALFHSTSSSDCSAIQRYNASTNSWTAGTVPTIIDQGSNSNFTRGQAWYDLIAAVDPNNANVVYIGGVDALRSDNGGSTWTQMTTWSLFAASGFSSAQNVHADHHAIVYAPGSSSRALWGTDGGVHYTANANVASSSKPTFENKNTGYNVTQYYACAIHPTNTNYFLGGAQDNGTQKFTSAGINATTDASDGDGAFCHIDQDNPNIQITSYVYNNYYVSTNGGTSFASVSFNNSGGFINPTDYDDLFNKLYAGNTAGSYFRWNNPASAGTSSDNVTCSQFSGSSVTHVAVSPTIANRVYFGLSNGSVVRVNNAHTGTTVTGTVIRTPTGLVSVSSIAIDINNENHMLVTYSNYGATSIFESFNANQASPTWTSVEGNLPDMPVRWVLFDPRNNDWALIATELGVWSTDNLNGASTDWQPTNSGFANTRVDMLQYRSSDRTIAAATHGRGLFTTLVPASSTPDINFQSSSSITTEQSGAVSGCRGYQDYPIITTIATAPSSNAIVNYSIEAGNTAREGVDFDFTTNGDFTNRSTTHTFVAGSTATQTITLRVYDDAEVEDVESLKLTYSLSGGAQAGTGAQTHTIHISDNDFAPLSASSINASIGTYNANLNGTTIFRNNKQKHRIQVLFTKAELNAAGIIRAAAFNSMVLRVATKNSTQPYNGFTISMANTNISSFSNFIFSGFTQVYTGNYTTTTGNNSFAFTTPFAWDGTSNVVVQFCFDNAPSAAGSSADIMEGNAAPLGSGVVASVYSNYTSGTTAGCSLPATSGDASRINASFGATLNETPIATILNSTKTNYLYGTGEQYFYSGSGEILAKINNLTSHDYGCTQVTIDRDGTASGGTAFAKPFWNNSATNYLTAKTWHITPTTNNTSGQYQITLYYTNAEKTGWEAATGQSWANIKIVKVKSQISNYTAATPAPDGSGGVEIVTPVIGTFGTNHTLTFTFSTGFSGFAAGIPGFSTLPVTLLNIQGELAGKKVALSWSTSVEQNSKNFEVEKSTNGTSYHKIGTVAAAGNSTSRRNYGLVDPQVAAVNYYRLKINDLDGRSKYSQVVIIRANVDQNVWVVNNPFKNHIDLRLAKGAGLIKLKLSNASGSLVAEKTIANPPDQLQWSLNKDLPKGVYILQAVADGKAFTSKLIKD